MGRVFLSYAREDAAKAKALAEALENASHTVWWDRHIRSGSEYGGAIEKALNEADAVVVLWSKSSIGSQWVRDEAAEGRESNRLIPVLLDDSRPPIGFRQLQALDLSKWTAKGVPKELPELLDSIAEHAPAAAPQARQTAAPPSRPRFQWGLRSGALIAAALLALAAVLYIAVSRSTDAEPATLAVLPFADLSPQKDKGFFTEGLAEEILSLVAREPGIRVIGRSSSALFQPGSSHLEVMRNSLGVTHVLEGSARTLGDELRLSVRLIETATGTEIWAQDYQRQLSNVFAVQDEIGRAVADRLRGTLSRPTAKRKTEVTSPEIYTLYLQARSRMRDRAKGPLEEARRLASHIIAADPTYAPGHALYAELTWLLSSEHYGTLAPGQAYRLARPHALHAIKLAPDGDEGYAALGLISQWRPATALEPLSRAVSLDPARAEVRLWLADTLSQVGRNTEALEHYKMLEDLEPLWQPSIALLAVSLAAAGEFDQARAIIDRFERRAGSTAGVEVLRGRLAEMRGDVSEAVKHVSAAARLDPQRTYTRMLLAWNYHMLGLPDRAQALADGEPLYTRLAVSSQRTALLAELRKSGAAVWESRDADVAIAALAEARDWRSLSRLYDEWRRIPQDGCFDVFAGGVTAHRRASAMMGPSFAVALRSVGRTKEAAALLACLKSSLARHSGGPIRHYSQSQPVVEFMRAQILALEGDRAQAMQAISRAIDVGWRGWFTTRLSGYPAFDSLQSSQEFRQLQARLDRLLAIDRAKTLRLEADAR